MPGPEGINGNLSFSSFVDAANRSLSGNLLWGADFHVTVKPDGEQVVAPGDNAVDRDIAAQGEEAIAGHDVRRLSADKGGLKEIATRYLDRKLHADRFVRSDYQKQVYNLTREKLLLAIKEDLERRGIKGVTLKTLPAELREALKLDDFGLKDTDGWNAQVTSGKPLTARRIILIKKALGNVYGNVQHAAVKDRTAIVVGILSGRAMPSQNLANQVNRKAVAADVTKLVSILKTLSADAAKSPEKKFFGTTSFNGKWIAFKSKPEQVDGIGRRRLWATVDGQTVEVPGGAEQLLERLEGDISLNVKFYGADMVRRAMADLERTDEYGSPALPPFYSGKRIVDAESIAAKWQPFEAGRKATFYQNVVKSVLGEAAYKDLPLSRLTLFGLRHVALTALNGGYRGKNAVAGLKQEIEDLGKKNLINNQQLLELREAMVESAQEDQGRIVQINPAPPPPADPDQEPPTEAQQAAKELGEKMHKLLADLVQRDETWKEDAQLHAIPGARLVDVLLDNVSAFRAMLVEPTAFDSFDYKFLSEGKEEGEPQPSPIKAQLQGISRMITSVDKRIAMLPEAALTVLLQALKTHMADPAHPEKAVEQLKTGLEAERVKLQQRQEELDKELEDCNFFTKALTLAGQAAERLAIKTKLLVYDGLAGTDFSGLFVGVAEKLAEGEKSISEAVDHALATVEGVMAANVQQVFKLTDETMEAVLSDAREVEAAEGDEKDKPAWQLTLADLAGGSALNPRSGLGRFMVKSLVQYYRNVSEVDKRAMVASLFRHTTAESTPGQVLGALLKGAGPIMQKTMQGLPEASMPEDLKAALADMKDALAPIPEEFVKAQLAAMVRDSDGQITSIKVVQSLGAASVGQAFLCEMTLSDGKTERCAVKLLRPDVQNRAQREREFFERIAASIPGMKETFAGDLSTIFDELDLTIEARNIARGQIYHQNPDVNIQSVQIHPLVRPSANALVLRFVEGRTLAGRMKEIRARLDEITKQTASLSPVGVAVHTVEKVDEYIALREELVSLYKELHSINQQLCGLSKKWGSEAIFQNGFFHGDLHSGNIMVKSERNPETGDYETKLTVIDYGNATQLSETEQQNVIKLLMASAARHTDAFVEGFSGLLSDNGKRAFARIKGRLSSEIGKILQMGVAEDSASRMMAVIMLVQKHNIEIPPPIYKFVKSEIRLSNSLDSTAALMSDIVLTMRSLSTDEQTDGIGDMRYGGLDLRAQIHGRLSHAGTDATIQRAVSLVEEFRGEKSHASFKTRFRELLLAKSTLDVYRDYLPESEEEKKLKIRHARMPDPATKEHLDFDDFIGDFVEKFKDARIGERDYHAEMREALKAYHDQMASLAETLKERIPEGKTLRQAYLDVVKDAHMVTPIGQFLNPPNNPNATTEEKLAAKAKAREVDKAKEAVLVEWQQMMEPAFQAAERLGDVLLEAQVAMATQDIDRLVLTKQGGLLEPDDFNAAFGNVIATHTGDALQQVGFWTGGKLALASQDVLGNEFTWNEEMDAALGTIRQAAQFASDGSYSDRVNDVAKGMAKDFASPDRFMASLPRDWAANAQARENVFEVLLFNLKEYRKRLEEAGGTAETEMFNLVSDDAEIENDLTQDLLQLKIRSFGNKQPPMELINKTGSLPDVRCKRMARIGALLHAAGGRRCPGLEAGLRVHTREELQSLTEKVEALPPLSDDAREDVVLKRMLKDVFIYCYRTDGGKAANISSAYRGTIASQVVEEVAGEE